MIEAIGQMGFEGNIDDVVKSVVPFLEQGFYLKEVHSWICWPYFWRRRYYVVIEYHMVYDGKHNATLPSTEQLIKELQ